jgi:hypothetical protein
MTGCSVLGCRQSVVTVTDGNLYAEERQWVTVTTTGQFVSMQMGQVKGITKGGTQATVFQKQGTGRGLGAYRGENSGK